MCSGKRSRASSSLLSALRQTWLNVWNCGPWNSRSARLSYRASIPVTSSAQRALTAAKVLASSSDDALDIPASPTLHTTEDSSDAARNSIPPPLDTSQISVFPTSRSNGSINDTSCSSTACCLPPKFSSVAASAISTKPAPGNKHRPWIVWSFINSMSNSWNTALYVVVSWSSISERCSNGCGNGAHGNERRF